MRIGIDARDLTRRPTGIAVYTRGIINALAESEAPHRFIQYFDAGGEAVPSERAVQGDNLETRILPNTGVIWKQARLPAALRKDRVDLFHSMTSTLPFYMPCRSVVTFCDLFHEAYPQFVPARTRRAMSRLYKRAAKTADRVTAISEYTKRDIVRRYGIPADSVEVIYPGANPFFHRVEESEVKALLTGLGIFEPYVLFVGALAEWRNIAGLLEAFANLGEEHKDLRLVTAGRPVWGFKMEENVAARGLEDRVVSLPRVTDEQLRALYCGASVFVLPSFFEGFGMPVVEAMACGTPVAVANATALPEAAGDAALLFDPASPEEIKAAISLLLTNKNVREGLVERGYEQAVKFTWQDSAERLLRVYESLA